MSEEPQNTKKPVPGYVKILAAAAVVVAVLLAVIILLPLLWPAPDEQQACLTAGQNDDEMIKVLYSTRDRGDWNCVGLMAEKILTASASNGHALYLAGEAARAGGDKTREMQHFNQYLSVEAKMNEAFEGAGPATCEFESNTLGYCPQRTGWIAYLMARNNFQTGRDSTNGQIRETFLKRAIARLDLSVEKHPQPFTAEDPKRDQLRQEINKELEKRR
ncbi:hypothetical protein [Hoeflea sp. TYP-13]|uniref:hypothetical protein n=1 Tax=Hoeflea sp. TYP-13 TaxID=3230023 RepID=UPI0034C5C5C5